MIRFDSPSAIWKPAPLMRSKSWIGGFSMKSTSPARSPATRAPWLDIGLKVTFAQCGARPQ